MPGYDQYARVAPQIPGSVKLGTLQAFWIDSGKSFEYQQGGKWFRFDVATHKAAEISAPHLRTHCGAVDSADAADRSAGGSRLRRTHPTASARRSIATATSG
jgi:hypothetical protein